MSWKLTIFSLLILSFIGYSYFKNQPQETILPPKPDEKVADTNPLMISEMKKRGYLGSDIKIEETLSPGLNYNRYIASYLSDGLKIYGLLTVPNADKPKNGWPIIIFNHGYIPPKQYKTEEKYVAYVDAFAKEGFVVFKPDFRGHGNSEGQPEGAYYSPAYAADVLNALSSVKKYPGVNPDKIGMWGHSMGGSITLRSMVVSKDIKVAVIWGGVVGTYDDFINNWQRRVTYRPPPNELANRNRLRSQIVQKYGSPKDNPAFWNTIDPNFYLSDISGPIQLHAGLEDEEVPWQFSQGLYERLKKVGKEVELYTYEGAGHNISSPSFEIAMQRSIDFFNKYLR